jgi:putative hydrolase of the HAD superfamily
VAPQCHISRVLILPFNNLAVIFDVGGVLVGSPFVGIQKYEKELNIPPGTISKQIVMENNSGPWGKWERSEITFAHFCHDFQSAMKEKGFLNFETTQFVKALEGSTVSIRKNLMSYISKIRTSGIKVAVITNNFYTNHDDSTFYKQLAANFDVFIESRVVKLNKPDPRIYQLTLDALQCKPNECIFLDDLGINLKFASNLGITTIKVKSEDQAIQDLDRLLKTSKL